MKQYNEYVVFTGKHPYIRLQWFATSDKQAAKEAEECGHVVSGVQFRRVVTNKEMKQAQRTAEAELSDAMSCFPRYSQGSLSQRNR